MPFLRAEFNAKNRRLGIFAWTRAINGKRFEPAEMRVFLKSGDFFWLAVSDRFLAWGESCVFGTWPEIHLAPEHQDGLPMSDLPKSGQPPCKVTLTIFGEPASKANSRELVLMNRPSSKHGGRMVKMPALIKSEKGRDYERDSLLQIPPSARARMECPVRVTIRIFYASERPDLDESLILDILQDRYDGKGDERVLVQSGVYRNDRQVREKHVYHGIDKANPRAEIEVEPIIAQPDMLSQAA